MKLRLALNGFGRIGRSILRIWAQGGYEDLDLVLINDIEPLDNCAYLFEYDSVFGPWRGEVAARDGALVVTVLHDLAMAARYCDRLLLMDGGALVADGAPMAVLTPERLASVYGVAARIDVNDGLPLIVPTARV